MVPNVLRLGQELTAYSKVRLVISNKPNRTLICVVHSALSCLASGGPETVRLPAQPTKGRKTGKPYLHLPTNLQGILQPLSQMHISIHRCYCCTCSLRVMAGFSRSCQGAHK